MVIYDELKQYAADCVSDKIPSCKKHKQACQRFLNDTRRTDADWEWDEAQALRIVKWFSLLRHSKGVLAGKPIMLTVPQKFFICQLYGWRMKRTGYKRFTAAFKEMGRKNAKSQEQAGILLYETAVESTRFGELYETYCAGVKRKQSGIIFQECSLMLRGSPLARKFKIRRDRITHIKSGSYIEPLNKEDGKTGDGTNPACLVLDEYHQHPDTSFYDLGLGGNSKQSLIVIITTAGVDLNSPCYTQEYKFCSNLLDPGSDVENDRYLADIFEADEGDDPSAPRTWEKANPVRMSYAEGREKIEEAFKLAQSIPEKMTAFKTKVLDIWVQAKSDGYMDMSKWKHCEVKPLPIDIRGCPVYIGFDMSSKIDLTSIAFVIPFESESTVKYIVFTHSFIPNREKLTERVRSDRVRYDLWEEQGYITVTDTQLVDQNAVVRYMEEFIARYDLDVQALCFDPHNSTKMEMELSEEGYPTEEVYQSARSLNECTINFRDEVFAGNIVYLPDPVLNFAVSNACIKKTNGLVRIDKDHASQRIDPLAAVLDAFKLAMYHVFIYRTADDWLDEE